MLQSKGDGKKIILFLSYFFKNFFFVSNFISKFPNISKQVILFFERKKAIRELTNKVEYDLAYGPPHQSGGSGFALAKAFERGMS